MGRKPKIQTTAEVLLCIVVQIKTLEVGNFQEKEEWPRVEKTRNVSIGERHVLWGCVRAHKLIGECRLKKAKHLGNGHQIQ